MIILLILHLSYKLSHSLLLMPHNAYHYLLIWYICVLNYIDSIKRKTYFSVSYFSY